MPIDNNATVTGNATRDPELRYTPGGAAVVNFGLAVNRRWQNRQTNEWEEEVSFFDVTAWAKLAENVAASVKKGMRVSVIGRLDQRSWDTKEGDTRSKVEIVADDVSSSMKHATVQVTRNPKEDQGSPRGERQAPPPQDRDDEPF